MVTLVAVIVTFGVTAFFRNHDVVVKVGDKLRSLVA